MKQTIYLTLITFLILVSGCDEKEISKEKKDALREKKANPAFMFWRFRKEIVSNTFKIPEMKTESAASYIVSRLRTIPGFVESSVNLSLQTMTITYRSSTVRKMNFEEAIALAGFSVNTRPASPNANIPKEIK